jgi:hypothetical protein
MVTSWIFAIMLTLALMNPSESLSQIPVPGINDLHQNPFQYFPKEDEDRDLVSSQNRLAFQETFARLYFLPWHQNAPIPGKGQILKRLKECQENPGCAEDGKRHSPQWMEAPASNAQLENYPNAALKGITLVASNLRELPTSEPYFKIFPDSGQKYAFDHLQYSGIPPNTPIFISHISRNKAWFRAESPYGGGWIPAEDAAGVDRHFIDTWTNGKYAALIKDGIPLLDANGGSPFQASVGSLFPAASEMEDHFEILIAARENDGGARIERAVLSKAHAALQPLRLTPGNMARVIVELLAKPYGWGGMHGNRDCSATLKDLFAPFGVWLPRDSGDQARTGKFIRLKGLTLEEKEKTILKDGAPFLTLLWIRGHIMLYIGGCKGRAVVFHNAWSTNLTDSKGEERERIIGKAVISDLYVGEEPARSRLSKIEGMTLLGK